VHKVFFESFPTSGPLHTISIHKIQLITTKVSFFALARLTFDISFYKQKFEILLHFLVLVLIPDLYFYYIGMVRTVRPEDLRLKLYRQLVEPQAGNSCNIAR
jgi:hypothetical protein